jgi:hypothetical protein
LQIAVDEMSLSNKITLAGIFAKNNYLGAFFHYVIHHVSEIPMSKMVQAGPSKGVNYEKFGFEQAALLLNCLRAARKQDVRLLTKL